MRVSSIQCPCPFCFLSYYAFLLQSKHMVTLSYWDSCKTCTGMQELVVLNFHALKNNAQWTKLPYLKETKLAEMHCCATKRRYVHLSKANWPRYQLLIGNSSTFPYSGQESNTEVNLIGFVNYLLGFTGSMTTFSILCFYELN
jgi:hypothetical protein